MYPIVDEWAMFFMDLMQEFQEKHNTTNFDEDIKKKKITPTWKKCEKVEIKLVEFLVTKLFEAEFFKFVALCFVHHDTDFLKYVQQV